MVKARKERRWARVATAVALCLPCSSLSFRCTRLTLLRLKAAASLPPMRTQSQLNREVQPVQRTVSHSAASPRSLPAMRTQSQYVSTQRRCQRKPLRALNVTPLHRQPGSLPRPVKTGGKPGCAEENADFFPPVTEYYKPDPAYAGAS